MSTSFWCSSCKKDHPGDCPPPQAPLDALVPAGPGRPGSGITAGKGLSFGGGSAPLTPGAPGVDWDLVDAYLDMTDDEIKQHYLAAKEALLRRLGAAPGPPPAP